MLYAIADVPSFVVPGGALDAETRRRGQTFYAPDGRIPLHPEVISEQAGSLLADQLCAASFGISSWTRRPASRPVRRRPPQPRQARLQGRPGRARRRNGPARAAAAEGSGPQRVELERERGGASLNMPEQEIVQLPDGGYRIAAAPQLPVEDWNAQISLMTGMAAANLMLEGKVGILRPMPAPDDGPCGISGSRPRRSANPGGRSLPRVPRSLDPTDPRQLAILIPRGLFAEPATRPLTAASPTTPSSRRSAPPTRTPPRRSGDLWTALCW